MAFSWLERGLGLDIARRVMRNHFIRHLPVVHDGKLVGIASDRDLSRFDKVSDTSHDTILVGEAMTKPAFAVAPHSPLRAAVAEMASRRLGSVVVVDGLRVVGLLTATDGLRALSVVLADQSETPK